MKSALAVSLILLSPAAAAAQKPAPVPIWTGWEGSLDIAAAPRLGEDKPLDSTQKLVDESEGEISLTLTKPKAFGPLSFYFKPGATWSPQYFDDEDPQSAYYGEVGLGEVDLPLHRLRLAGEKRDADPDVLDAVLPYALYRHTRVYDDFFDAFDRTENQVTVGIRYRDVRTIFCPGLLEKPRAAEVVGACSNIPGVSWELRGEVSRIWSSDPNERRLAPGAKLEIISHPLWSKFRLFGRGAVEARFYDDALVPLTGKRREELRARLGAGVDFSPWLEGTPLKFELEGQFQQRWSNDEAREHDRFYFIPAVTLSASF